MSKTNKHLYSQIYKSFFIRHDDVRKIEDLLEFCFDSFDGITEPTCLLIIGDSGLGKTIIVENFHSEHPDYNKKIKDTENTIKPIIRFSLPSNAKRYEAIRAFLKAIGDPRWNSRDSFDIKNDRLIYLLSEVCETRLIIIDEFHHITQAISPTEIIKTGEWLKLLIKETSIPVVGVGMPWAQMIQTSNKQIGTIFTMVEELFPFKIIDKDDLLDYMSFLNTVSSRLNKLFSINASCLITPEIALPLFVASEGYHKILMKIIAASCSKCKDNNLKLSDFEMNFKYVFGSSKPNPFASQYLNLSSKQIIKNPEWSITKEKITPPAKVDVNIRDIFSLGRSSGIF